MMKLFLGISYTVLVLNLKFKMGYRRVIGNLVIFINSKGEVVPMDKEKYIATLSKEEWCEFIIERL